MSAPTFSLLTGIAYLVLGLAGSTLFGLVSASLILNLLYLLVGLWGFLAWTGYLNALRFARVNALLFGVLAILGLASGLNFLAGYLPLNGSAVWLHAVTALAAAYIGFRSMLRRGHHLFERRRHRPDRRQAGRPVAYERRWASVDRRFGDDTHLAAG